MNFETVNIVINSNNVIILPYQVPCLVMNVEMYVKGQVASTSSKSATTLFKVD